MLAKTGDRRKKIEQLAWVCLFGISLSTMASLLATASRDWFAFIVLCRTKVHLFMLAARACATRTAAARLKLTFCLLTAVHVMFASYVILLEQLHRNEKLYNSLSKLRARFYLPASSQVLSYLSAFLAKDIISEKLIWPTMDFFLCISMPMKAFTL